MGQEPNNISFPWIGLLFLACVCLLVGATVAGGALYGYHRGKLDGAKAPQVVITETKGVCYSEKEIQKAEKILQGAGFRLKEINNSADELRSVIK